MRSSSEEAGDPILSATPFCASWVLARQTQLSRRARRAVAEAASGAKKDGAEVGQVQAWKNDECRQSVRLICKESRVFVDPAAVFHTKQLAHRKNVVRKAQHPADQRSS